MIYICLFFLLGTYSLADINRRSVLGRTHLVFLSAVLVVLGGIRWFTGSDWNSYYYFFGGITDASVVFDGQFEFGFNLLSYLSKSIGGSFTFFLFCLSFLTVGLKVYAIILLSRRPYMSLFLVLCFYLGDIFAVRFSLALSILLLSTVFVVQRRPVMFVLTVLISSTVHITSLFFLFAYPAFYMKLSTLAMVVLLSVSVVIAFIGESFTQTLQQLVGTSGNDGAGLLFKLTVYISGSEQNSGDRFVFSLLKKVMMIPVFLYFRKQLSERSEFAMGYLNLYVIGSCIQLVFSSILQTMQRFGTMFAISEILLLPMLFDLPRKKENRLFLFFLFLLYAGAKLYYAVTSIDDFYLPYYTIFSTDVQRSWNVDGFYVPRY